MSQERVSQLVSQNWFKDLIDNIESTITEGVFQSRWTLIETYHEVGKSISEHENEFEKLGFSTREVVQRVAKALRRSERSVYYAVQFYERYPTLDELPEGKNISWRKITQKYLPESEDESLKKDTPPKNEIIWCVCPQCQHDFKWDIQNNEAV